MRLQWLRQTTSDTGPFATVLMDVTHDSAEGEHQARLRWRALREDLSAQGADETTLRRLDDAVAEAAPPDGTAGRVLVTGASGVLLDHYTAVPPERGGAHWGNAPDLLTVVSAVPEEIRTVVVGVDEEGGEVRGPDDAEAERVRGDRSGPVHKASAGDPNETPMQERVEETWRRNAKAVAERVDAAVRSGGAQLVVLVGDGRSRSRVRDELSAGSVELVAEVEHSGGESATELPATVVAAADDVRARRRDETVARYAAAAGRADGFAVTGLGDVLAATRAHAVEVLVLDPDQAPEGEVWVGDDITELAVDRNDLVALGRTPDSTVQASSALIRAAAATDAELVLIDAHAGHDVALDEGVGAVLRFPVGPAS